MLNFYLWTKKDKEKNSNQSSNLISDPDQSTIKLYGIADCAKYNEGYIKILEDLNIYELSYKDLLEEFITQNHNLESSPDHN